MHSLVISHRRLSVFRLYVREKDRMCPWPYTESLLAQYLTNCLWEFHQLTALVHLGTKMIWVDFESKRSKMKVTMRPDVAKNHLFKRLNYVIERIMCVCQITMWTGIYLLNSTVKNKQSVWCSKSSFAWIMRDRLSDRRLVFSDQACLLTGKVTCISVLCHLVDALGTWWRHISFDWGCGTFDFCF